MITEQRIAPFGFARILLGGSKTIAAPEEETMGALGLSGALGRSSIFRRNNTTENPRAMAVSMRKINTLVCFELF